MPKQAQSVLLVANGREEDHLLAEGLAAEASEIKIVPVRGSRAAACQLMVEDFDTILLCPPALREAPAELSRLLSRAGSAPVVVYGPEASEAQQLQLIGDGAADYLIRGSLERSELQLLSRCLNHQAERARWNQRQEASVPPPSAQQDELTGLPNTQQLRRGLRQLIAHSRRHGRSLAVLCLDLDRFKTINESFGPRVGDRLIRVAARRLSGCVRESDILARRGGDEFTVVLEDVARSQDAARVARKVLKALSEPYRVDGNELIVSTSIGIGMYPADGADAETLLENADVAMGRAKATGGSTYQFFRPELNERALERLQLEQELRLAIERGEFVLDYQPQVGAESGEIVAMEALVRWHHPTQGLMSPGTFIPLAEDTGLIIPLGEWVLREACRQNRKWQDDGLAKVPVAVNLSAVQFQSKRPAERVHRILEECGLEPEYLDLELTESAVMKEVDAAAETLSALRDIGVTISIDDFGTGHSSLSYLKRFPISRLKIDKCFVQHVISDPCDAAITRTIVSLARNLGLQAVAEGVESVEQLDFLRELGCDHVQGFLFSRPVSVGDAGRMLAARVVELPALSRA